MWRALRGVLWAAAAGSALAAAVPASAQVYPNIPANTVLGRLGAGQSGQPQAIPFAAFLPQVGGSQNPNLVFASPSATPAGFPSFRALVPADVTTPIAITGISDPNFSSNCGGSAVASAIPGLNENWCLNANYNWIRSTDQTIYPAQFNVGGTWANGDTAAVRVVWGSTTLNYSCMVGSVSAGGCGTGTSVQTIADALQTLMAVDTTNLKNNLIFVQAVGEVSSSVYEFQIVPQYSQYAASPSFTISNQSTSVSGTITVSQTSNILSDPTGLICSRSVSGRTPQDNDYICGVEFWGQPTSSGGTQLYARMQAYIDVPDTSGRFQFQTFASGINGVQNAMIIRNGVYLSDSTGTAPTDGTNGDKGWGWFNVPVAGGYDLSGAGTLMQNGAGQVQLTALGSNAIDLATSSNSKNIFLSPNGSTVLQVNPNGINLNPGIIAPTLDSTTALRLMNTALSTSVLTVDTSNNRVGIDKTPGAFALDVNGAINASGQYGGTATNDGANAGNIGEYVVSGAGSFSGVGTSATVTISIASPAVISWSNNPYFISTATGNGCASVVVFSTGGSLPTGITAGTPYYVTCNASFTANAFNISTSIANAVAGTTVNTSGTQSGTQTATNSIVLSSGASPVDLGGLSLTAGDWDVTAFVFFTPAASTSVTISKGFVSSATGGGGTTYSFGEQRQAAEVPGGGFNQPMSTERVSLSTTTTLFCDTAATFTVSTMTASMECRARRVR